MRRLLRLAVWLYPQAWRARYGAEFDALLEDTNPGWQILGDVLKGAIDMQLTHWKFTRIVAICGAVGLVAAAAIAFRMHDSYVSRAVIHIDRVGMPLGETAGLRQTEVQVLSRSALAGLIRKFDLYPEERKTLPLEDVIENMRNRNISIVPFPISQNPGNGAQPFSTFQIVFSYPDPAKAQAVTRELANRMIAAGVPVVSLAVVDPASLPGQPVSPNRAGIVLAGLAIGLAAGIILAGSRRWPVVAIAGIAGMLLAGAISFAIPDRWVSTAVVRVRPAEAAAPLAAALGQNAAGMDIQVIAVQSGRQPGGSTGALEIRSKGRDRQEAQANVRQFVTRLIENNAAHPIAGGTVSIVEVLDPASFPQRPYSPNRLTIAILGLVAGLLLGAFWLWMRPRRALVLPV